MTHTQATLTRDCPATLIPAGDVITLAKGSEVTIAQALGGSVTVRDGMGLYRIEPGDIDALGEDVAAEVRSTQNGEDRQGDFSEETLWEVLKECYDPEIPVNIVDLGLIYDLSISDVAEGRRRVDVKMTLTAQGCGMGPHIAADARQKLLTVPTVEEADVQIIWDPQWTPHMISQEGRKKLGLE